MSEITRTEKFLRACIDGEPCALKPLTRMEKLLAELNETLAGGPSEVVILPETEVTVNDGRGGIMTPPNQLPEDGATVIVSYNGTDYECKVAFVDMNGMKAFVMGNTAVLGIVGGNPDAPFVVAVLQEGLDGVYVMVMPMGDATSITLSIVEKAETASAGGGLFIVCENGVPCEPISSGAMMAVEYQCNKTGGELIEAFNSGQYIAINVINPMGEGSDVRMPCLTCNGTADAGFATCGVYVKGVSMIGTVMWEAGVTSIIFEIVQPAG